MIVVGATESSFSLRRTPPSGGGRGGKRPSNQPFRPAFIAQIDTGSHLRLPSIYDLGQQWTAYAPAIVLPSLSGSIGPPTLLPYRAG